MATQREIRSALRKLEEVQDLVDELSGESGTEWFDLEQVIQLVRAHVQEPSAKSSPRSASVKGYEIIPTPGARMSEQMPVQWKPWPENDTLSLQRVAEIDGVSCTIDLPYDDTVDYRFHAYINHPDYLSGVMSAETRGHSSTYEGAKLLAERRARHLAQWCGSEEHLRGAVDEERAACAEVAKDYSDKRLAEGEVERRPSLRAAILNQSAGAFNVWTLIEARADRAAVGEEEA